MRNYDARPWARPVAGVEGRAGRPGHGRAHAAPGHTAYTGRVNRAQLIDDKKRPVRLSDGPRTGLGTGHVTTVRGLRGLGAAWCGPCSVQVSRLQPPDDNLKM